MPIYRPLAAGAAFRRAVVAGTLLVLLSPAVATALTVERHFSPADLRSPAVAGSGGDALVRHVIDGVACPEAVTWVALPPDGALDRVVITGGDRVDVSDLEAGRQADLAGRLPGAGETLPAVVSEGWMRGSRLAAIRYSPLAWDAERGVIVLYRSVRLDVMTRPDPVPADVLQPRRGLSPGDRRFRSRLVAMVANPEAFPASALAAGPERGALQPETWSQPAWNEHFRPSLAGRPVDLLIITGAGLVSEYQRLADWRTRSGRYTVIRTVEEITQDYPEGVDPQEKIRRFIRDAVGLWGVDWVLLGGDVDVVPIRNGRTQYFGGEDIPTDLYYQCLDRSWNENGNSAFGEGAPPGTGTLPADNADLLPDVWLARLPCSTPAGTRDIIDKTLLYEKSPPAGDFLTSFLALGEVLQPSNWLYPDTVVFDGATLCEEAIARLRPGFRVTRMYENYPAWPGSLPENRPAVLDSISAGYGIVYHAGHGFHNNLSVGLGGLEIFKEDTGSFDNGGRPFLFFGINCNSAALDFDCMAERFLNQPHGAFGYIGSTRFDFPGAGDPYQANFFNYLMQGVPLGEAHALSKLPEVPLSLRDGAERWHQMSLVCLADPLVTIASSQAATLTVQAPFSVPLGQPVSVTVTREGLPLSGARVTLYRAGDVFASDTTGATGQISLDCPVDTPGSVALTVTARNARPFEGSVTMQAGLAAFPVVTGLTVDDVAGGNGNGRLEAGEEARLLFHVRNDGGASAANLSLTLSGEAAGLTIVQPTADIGTLGAGLVDSTGQTVDIQILVATTAAAWLDVPATLHLAWESGSRSEPVGLRVGGTQLVVLSQSFVDDPGGPGQDGNVLPNETIALHPIVMNRGGGAAGKIHARLISTDPRVTLLTSDVTVGTLASGASTGLPTPLTFKVTELAAIAFIDLVVDSEDLEQLRRSVDLTPPAAPAAPEGRSRPSSILLAWVGNTDSDLRGYAVFRADQEAGPWTRLNEFVDNPMGWYEDTGLLPFSRHWYRIAAMDRSGNLSAPSPAVRLSTGLPALSNWPIRRLGATPSSPVIHDLDGDGILEILIGGEEIYCVRADGTEYRNGDQDSRTLGVLTRTNGALFWATPAVADVDNDGVLDIVCAGWNDGKLYVFGSDGAIRPGWPRSLGAPPNQAGGAYPWGSPLVVDIDGDGPKEIFIPGDRYLFGFRPDGSEIRDGDGNPATTGPFLDLEGPFNYGTPAAADLDHDGLPEIAVGTRSGKLFLVNGDGSVLAGFPKSFGAGGQITGSPAIADLDKDGELDVIVPVRTVLEVHAVNRFGVEVPGWPQRININQDLDSSPTVGDLDGDGFLDVVMAGGTGRVSAWHGQNGQLFNGFPVDLSAIEDAQTFSIRGTACLGDVTGDGHPDIVVGTSTGTLYGIDVNGLIVGGFPVKADDNIEGGPLLWDIDGDGHTNVVFGSIDKTIYAYDCQGIFSPTACPWPMFRHDQLNSGLVTTPVTTPVEPELTRFELAIEGGAVRVGWEAPADDWVGWWIDRETVVDGAVHRLVEAPLTGVGSMEFLDRSAPAGARCRYWLTAIDRDGGEQRFAPREIDVPAGAPRALRLSAAPNPFRGSTTIAFELSAGAANGAVRLTIHDLAGRRVRTLVDGLVDDVGSSRGWDGTDDSGRPLPAGVYFARLESGALVRRHKVTLTR